MSNFHYSFGQWCEDNSRQDLLDRWNSPEDPFEISFKSNKKYRFLCPRHLHEDIEYNLYDIAEGKNKTVKCKKCNSFGQFIADKFGEEYLDKIWSDKNEKTPFDYATNSNKKVWFICVKDSEHVYDMPIIHFVRDDVGCPYCSGHRVLKKDSLGVKFPKVLNVWSDKNDTTPYEYSVFSSVGVWWKCENGIHEDFKRTIANSHPRDYECPLCARVRSYDAQKEDVSGKQYHELTALYYIPELTRINQKATWMCRCSCGAMLPVQLDRLKSGNTKTCGNRTIHYSRDNNGNWQGGKTSELHLARNNAFYDKWREDVYAKDWYTCQCCGKSKGIDKEAHHFSSFAEDIDRRYDISNGILLCKQCHSAVVEGGFHYVYGVKDNTPQQLEEYINNKRKSLGIDVPFSYKEYLNGAVIKPNELSSQKSA